MLTIASYGVRITIHHRIFHLSVTLPMDKLVVLETIEQFYRLLKDRDREGLLEILSPDLRVRYYGPKGELPWVGEYIGTEGFKEFLDIIASHLDIVKTERLDTVTDDHKVVVQIRGCWRSKKTGKDIHGDMINIFSVDQGRITSYEVYNDTLAFARGIESAID